jgi:hypothetical protein
VDSNIESIYNSARGFLDLQKWDDASKLFSNMIKQDSTDYRGWWGLFLAKTHNMKLINTIGKPPIDFSDAENALDIAPDSQKQNIASQFSDYKKRCPQMYVLTVYREPRLNGCAVDIGVLLDGIEKIIWLGSNGSERINVPCGKQKISIYSSFGQRFIKSVVFDMITDDTLTVAFSMKPFEKVAVWADRIPILSIEK